MNDRTVRWILPVAAGVTLLAVWYALRHWVGIQPWVLPMPDEIARAVWAKRDLFAAATWQTTQSALLGFVTAATTGLGLAVLLGTTRWVRRSLYPYLLMLQMTPVIVIAPLINLWIPHPIGKVVIVTFIVSFFPVVVNTTAGMVSTDRRLLELFELCKASRWQRIFLLQLPSAMPFYFAGLRIAATLAPIGAIFGEFITGSSAGGLGYFTYAFNSRQERAELMGIAAASCLLGLVFLALISLVNWLLLRRWHDSIVRTDV